MENDFFSHRNMYKLHGLLAILFGLVAVIFPGITIVALAVFFAIFILLGGVFLVAVARKRRKKGEYWQPFLIEGILGILIGLIILARPNATTAFFMVLVGLWALLSGLVLLWSYFRKRPAGSAGNYNLVVGLIYAVFGLLIITNPFTSTRLVIIIIGVFTIIYGILAITDTSRNHD
ncbi:MAG: DUF308 domain-containing protein [Bacteroidales bacterium]|nr:DUF308 domain-containing protein [Bacteroidales bacterium]